MCVVPQTRAARSDASFGRGAGHLDHHQTGAAQGACAQVHQMEIADHTVLRAVSGHRRDHDAVFQGELAQFERHQHGRHDAPAGQPGFVGLQPVAVAQTQVFVADTLRAGEQRISELLNLHVGVAFNVFKPSGGIARRVLDFQYLDAAPVLVGLQHFTHVRQGMRGKGIGEVNGVFQRQLGAAAYGVMRGVRRVSHEHHGYGLVPVHPVLTNDARKLYPDGRAAQMQGIAHQRMAVKVFGK